MDNPSYIPFEKAAEQAMRNYLVRSVESLSICEVAEFERDQQGHFRVVPVDFGEERGMSISSDRLDLVVRIADGDLRGFTASQDPKEWKPTVKLMFEVFVDGELLYSCFDDGSHCPVGQELTAPCTDPAQLPDRIGMLPTSAWLFETISATLKQSESPSMA